MHKTQKPHNWSQKFLQFLNAKVDFEVLLHVHLVIFSFKN